MPGKACPGEGRGPGIHVLMQAAREDVDAVAKPRHDDYRQPETIML
jgi:hypothetical protein